MGGYLDFGYPWWLSYGHVAVAGFFLLLLAAGVWRHWPRGVIAVLTAGLLWAGSAFVVARFVLNINGRAALPTGNFLVSGEGRVLDMGAGTGRSALMVLEARPHATVLALDEFGRSYKQHFGDVAGPEQKLIANLRSAGVAHRATVRAGDMRKMPFGDSEFDAIVSCYAIDHLGRAGAQQALSEAARVLKPGGQFLLVVIAKDGWLKYAFGPLLLHSGTRDADWWSGRLREAGFDVTEHGMRPATLYLLANKHGS